MLIFEKEFFICFWQNQSIFQNADFSSQLTKKQIQVGKLFLHHFTKGRFFSPSQDQVFFLTIINFNQELLRSFCPNINENVFDEHFKQITQLKYEINKLKLEINKLKEENTIIKQDFEAVSQEYQKECENSGKGAELEKKFE